MIFTDLFENTNQPQGVLEGHADQQKKIVKRNGQPVGEIGIDRESSPGVGQYYMKHYASGTDNSGYDSREEALDDLRHIMKQSVYGELKQGVAEAMKPSDIPPSMRDRLTIRDIERERPQGAFRFRVTFPDGQQTDYMTFDAAQKAAQLEKGRISRISEEDVAASSEPAMATEGLRDGEYHVAKVTLDDGTVKQIKITADEGFRDRIMQHFAKQGREVRDIDVDYAVRSDLDETKKKPQPTNPDLWSRAKAAARSKFDVYPSAYANAWAAKWYKSKGGGWRMGKPKKD